MNVYLMRHGPALETGEAGVSSDAERPLSSEGRRRTAEVAKGLRELGVRPAVCVSSPLRRAAQTAEIAARILRSETEICDELLPGGDAQEFLKWLDGRSAAEVLAVGHMPDLSVLLSLMVCGHAGLRCEFKKAGVAGVQCDTLPRAGTGCLLWLLTPAMLRTIAKGA
jgi:phosphohistidine phosphatase